MLRDTIMSRNKILKNNVEFMAEITDKSLGFKTAKAEKYRLKKSVRNVILDPKGRIVLLYWRQPDSYVLPGGKPDGDESLWECAKREAREETGYKVAIRKNLGAIISIRSKTSMLQISYCFLSHAVGSPKAPKLTSYEKEEGISVTYAKNLDDAVRLIKLGRKSYDNEFRRKRDILFLQRAKDLINK